MAALAGRTVSRVTLHGFDIAGVNGPGIITRALTGDFVICKATEGKGFDDPLHDQFVAAARTAGKHVGHYHYAWPENGGVVDAQHFLGRAHAEAGDVVALDFEPFKTVAPAAEWPCYIREFAHVVFDALKVWPWLYSEDYHLGVLAAQGSQDWEWVRRVLPLWKAGMDNAYTHDPDVGPGNTYGFARVAAYQWDATGIDSDRFYGDAAAWAALATPGGTPVATTSVHVDSTDPTDKAYVSAKRLFVTKEGALWVVADFPKESIGPGDVWVGLLKFGTADSDSVRRAQRQLKIEQTGNYETATDAAVRAWQESIGNTPDPEGQSSIGPKQAARLFEGSGDTLRPGVPPRGVEVVERVAYLEGPQNIEDGQELPDPDSQAWKPDLPEGEGEGS